MRIRFAVIPLLFFVGLLAGPRYAAADKVYLLNNYPAQQAGGTLSGQITVTDTAADDGLLAVAEILAWSFTSTDAGAVHTQTLDSNTSPGPGIILQGAVQITAQQILLAAPNAGGITRLEFASVPVSSLDGNVDWIRSRGDTANFDQYLVEDSAGTNLSIDDVLYWNTSGAPFALGGTDPWVIATALPEPSSFALLILGALGALAWRRNGRRRA